MELSKLLIQLAHNEGFPLAGVIDIELALSSSQSFFTSHVRRYDEWIKNGYSGAMQYLVRGRDQRADPRLLFPEAQSMLCVAIPYPRKPAGAPESTHGPRYARYLQGPDYHQELHTKLESIMRQASQKLSTHTDSSSAPPLRWKVCVDTSAVLERTWAALAGLGWIGKNSLLIHPQHGSYLFLAEVLINQRTGVGPHPLPNFCGHCTRCMQACPTQALIEPGVLNSNRCISYWTLEKRGELSLSPDDQRGVKQWIAGCDICQEVCPFNKKPTQKELTLAVPIDTHATTLHDWIGLLKETQEEYQARVKHSALNRIKPAQFRRNLAITLTNAIEGTQNLQQTLGSDPSLDDSPYNSSHPANHIQDQRLKPESLPLIHPSWIQALKPLIREKLLSETDEFALKEWAKCLSILSQNSDLNQSTEPT